MKKILFTILAGAFGFASIAQNYNPKIQAIHNFVPNASKAGACNEVLKYYTTESGLVSTMGYVDWRAVIYIDQDELAFFHDTSSFSFIRFSFAYELYDAFLDEMYSTFDSAHIEIFEGSVVSGTDINSSLSLGTLIYQKNVTSEILGTATGFASHSLDSLVPIDNSKTYAVALRIFQSDPEPCIGVDVGPAKLNKGAWVVNGGTSFQRTDENWLMEVCINGSLIVPDNNLTVTSVASNYDAYEIMSLKQIENIDYEFEMTVRNNGKVAASGIKGALNVTPNNYTDEVNGGSLNPNTSKKLTFPNTFKPFLPGEHVIEYSVSSDSVNFYVSDNKFLSRSFYVEEAKYGRVERGNITESSGTVAGLNSVFKGNVMDIFTEDTLKYIEVYLRNPKAGARMAGFCIAWDETANEPIEGADTLLTDTFNITSEIVDNGDTVIVMSFINHTELTVGKYLFGVIDIEGTTKSLGLATNNRNYVEKTSYWTANLASSGNWINQWVETESYYPVVMVFSNIYNTSVKENNNFSNNVHLYPNPTNGSLTITFDNFKPTTIRIVDLTGRTIQTQNVNNTSKSISLDLNDLEKGIYFIHLNEGSKSAVKKVILN